MQAKLVVVIGLTLLPMLLHAQSLGDLAKAEVARRAALPAAAAPATSADPTTDITTDPKADGKTPEKPPAKKIYTNKDLEHRPAPTMPREAAVPLPSTTAASPIPQKDLDLRDTYRRRRAQLQAKFDEDNAVLEAARRRAAYLVHMVTNLSVTNHYRPPYVEELSVLRRRIEELQRTVDADRKAAHDWETVNR